MENVDVFTIRQLALVQDRVRSAKVQGVTASRDSLDWSGLFETVRGLLKRGNTSCYCVSDYSARNKLQYFVLSLFSNSIRCERFGDGKQVSVYDYSTDEFIRNGQVLMHLKEGFFDSVSRMLSQLSDGTVACWKYPAWREGR